MKGEKNETGAQMKTSVDIGTKASFCKGGVKRSLTEDFINLDSAKGDKSSVSYADSSFAKGAFGYISSLFSLYNLGGYPYPLS